MISIAYFFKKKDFTSGRCSWFQTIRRIDTAVVKAVISSTMALSDTSAPKSERTSTTIPAAFLDIILFFGVYRKARPISFSY